MLGIKDLVIEIEETVELHREIARKSLSSAPWYNKLTQESQYQMADLGRRLLNIIIKYITEPSRREENILLSRQVGREHGELLANHGLPLADAVEAFLMHREPIQGAVSHLMKKREALSGRVVEAIPLVTVIIDESLLALVAAHQQYRNRDGQQA